MNADNSFNPDRRDFLKAAAATGLVLGAHSIAQAQQNTPTLISGDAHLSLVGAIPSSAERTWIAPQYWGNRLQDWRVTGGRIECVAQKKERDLCTVSLLTREVLSGADEGTLTVTTGRANSKGKGFSGFLIGAGAGKLDYRAASLVQRGSGIGGGILCVYNPDGLVEFREHTNEKEPVLFEPLKWDVLPAEADPRMAAVDLRLDILPAATAGRFDLKLTASQDSKVVSAGVLRAVLEEEILGGVMLCNGAISAPDGACFWFKDVKSAGTKIGVFEDRAMGPIVAGLHSLNGSIMKLSAQFMPIGNTDPQEATLQVREPGSSEWRSIATEPVKGGFTALFRVADWDSTKDWEYQVVYGTSDATAHGSYQGLVKKDPSAQGNLKIGLYSCTIATNRLLDRGQGPRMPSFARFLGRYTPECICFPFNELVKNGSHHKPDILFFVGDQFYEDNPSVRDPAPSPTLDYIYKWVLWVWGFRDMTRDTPTIILTDDHDVFQPNLFGNGGREAPEEQYNHGGYRPSPEWVNMVQRTQCGHNPDPYDPTPVQQGITVYYGAFTYGGVEFAFLEDRKWKTAPWQGRSLDVHEAELLGERQEKFLAEWGQKVKDNPAKIVASQTIFACVQTGPNGKALLDFDANSYPPLQRRRAMELIRDAGALIISGDQHLATLIRNGIDEFDDGPVQFTGPAGAATWTRWFQPTEPLPNAHETPYTGDFIDAFGNKCHVYAVANPDKLTMKQYWDDPNVRPPTQYIGDRDLKAEGYCMIDVNKDQQLYNMECWRWDVDPSKPDAKPYPGWPVQITFDEAGKSKSA